jgi:hypothetical protein
MKDRFSSIINAFAEKEASKHLLTKIKITSYCLVPILCILGAGLAQAI